MKKLYFSIMLLYAAIGVQGQNILYSNNFENGVGGATIVGNGEIIDSENSRFGRIFHNAKGGEGIRQNYLLLPNNIFANLQTTSTNQLTISFWINKGTATNFYWSPIFTAYGAAPINNVNTWPMLALQSRLLAQVNCAGWTNFENAQNATGKNRESTEWLDDSKWHFYAATYTATSVKIYIDGIVQNEWAVSQDDGKKASGIFSHGSELKYICLGGNQSWDWNDPDPAYMFDDLAIYSTALTAEQMQSIITAKLTPTSATDIEYDSCVVGEEFYTISGAKTGSQFIDLDPGIYIKRTIYDNGKVISSKVVKHTK